MKYMLLIVLLFTLVWSSPIQAQNASTHYILNATVSGGTYSFEIWSQKTSAAILRVGITTYYFDLDNSGGFDFGTAPVLSHQNTRFNSTDGSVNDYGPMTAQYVGTSPKKLAVTINYTGNNAGTGTGLANTVPNGEQMCTVTLTIANTEKTASLAWDLSNSAMSTSNIQPNTNSFVGSDNSRLPVELTTFSAVVIRRDVELNWSTATENKNSGFEVERRMVEGKENVWQSITFMPGHGTTNSPQNYIFHDVVKKPTKYQYRLKQIDANGKFEYSKEIEAIVPLQAEDYQLSTNFPNPFNPTTSIRFAVKKAEHVAIIVFNTLGQEVCTLFNDIAAPDVMHDLTFDAKGLASGTYFYTLKAQDRFEVKKMQLIR
jgi:hypothetical protein